MLQVGPLALKNKTNLNRDVEGRKQRLIAGSHLNFSRIFQILSIGKFVKRNLRYFPPN
jgi:hypothetical protein